MQPFASQFSLVYTASAGYSLKDDIRLARDLRPKVFEFGGDGLHPIDTSISDIATAKVERQLFNLAYSGVFGDAAGDTVNP